MSGRNQLIAKVKIAQKDLRMEDADYRALLGRVTGQASASTCSEPQLLEVIKEMKRMGFVPKVVGGGKAAPSGASLGGSHSRATSPAVQGRRKAAVAAHPSARKARALWISLWQLGVVRNRSEVALEGFAARQLKVDKLQWADEGQMFKLIEALKAMAERAGWSQDLSGIDLALHTTVLKQRLDALLAARET